MKALLLKIKKKIQLDYKVISVTPSVHYCGSDTSGDIQSELVEDTDIERADIGVGSGNFGIGPRHVRKHQRTLAQVMPVTQSNFVLTIGIVGIWFVVAVGSLDRASGANGHADADLHVARIASASIGGIGITAVKLGCAEIIVTGQSDRASLAGRGCRNGATVLGETESDRQWAVGVFHVESVRRFCLVFLGSRGESSGKTRHGR